MNSSLQMAFGMTTFAVASCLVVAGFTADPGPLAAVQLAALIATFNGVGALVLSHVGATRSTNAGFFGAVFGGMVLRMGTTLAGLLIGVKILLLPAVPFAVALLTFTALFTAAEVALWSRQNFSPKVQLS
ncbi:MAG: hypothetical protein KBH14_02935 [Vicinamibacteria bacterium]|nr:hypothetical protein [Vicinamibacteria bacterium]MBP9945327.1 hypothetical protein [Vicinamibacteria bacterium]